MTARRGRAGGRRAIAARACCSERRRSPSVKMPSSRCSSSATRTQPQLQRGGGGGSAQPAGGERAQSWLHTAVAGACSAQLGTLRQPKVPARGHSAATASRAQGKPAVGHLQAGASRFPAGGAARAGRQRARKGAAPEPAPLAGELHEHLGHEGVWLHHRYLAVPAGDRSTRAGLPLSLDGRSSACPPFVAVPVSVTGYRWDP